MMTDKRKTAAHGSTSKGGKGEISKSSIPSDSKKVKELAVSLFRGAEVALEKTRGNPSEAEEDLINFIASDPHFELLFGASAKQIIRSLVRVSIQSVLRSQAQGGEQMNI